MNEQTLNVCMQLLPLDTRKMHWTRGLAQMCRLLEHHKVFRMADQARCIPFMVKGERKTDMSMKLMSRIAKRSICSLPRCKKDDFNKEKLKICSRCNVAKYCSRKHQVEHWKAHKPECKKLKKCKK